MATKDAVGTCLLSKAWKYMWTDQFVLDFEWDHLLDIMKLKTDRNNHACKKLSFESFVNGVLLLSRTSHMIQRVDFSTSMTSVQLV